MDGTSRIWIILSIFASVIVLCKKNEAVSARILTEKKFINSSFSSWEKLPSGKQVDNKPANITSNEGDNASYKCSNKSQLGVKENLHKTVKLPCKNETVDGRAIRMVNACPANFHDKFIAYDCETTNKTELLMDFRLSLPVTSRANITYRNVFCAYCNGERHYTFWDIRLNCVTEFNTTLGQRPKVDNELILSNLTINGSSEALTSNVNDKMFTCAVDVRPPYASDRFIINHSINSGNRTYAYSQSFPVDFHDEHLPRYIKYNNTSSYIVNGKLFSQFSRNSHRLKNSCFFITDGQFCKKTYTGLSFKNFHFVNNETVYANDLHAEFGADEWSDTFVKDFIFVCISIEKDTDYDNIPEILLILKAFSIFFFLLLLIAIGSDEKKRKSLSSKIIFSYSLSVLLVYTTNMLSFWLTWCKGIGPVSDYLKLCSYVWLSVLVYDFWRMIYYSSNLLIEEARESRQKRFLIYSCICWIFPLSIISFAVYLEFNINGDLFPCELRPAYGKTIFCQMTQKMAANWFITYPLIVTNCTVIILSLHSSYHISFMCSKNRNTRSSRRVRNNFKVLMKLTWTMGLAFTISSFSELSAIPFTRLLFDVLNQSQGVILYIIHGYDRGLWKNIYLWFSYVPLLFEKMLKI